MANREYGFINELRRYLLFRECNRHSFSRNIAKYFLEYSTSTILNIEKRSVQFPRVSVNFFVFFFLPLVGNITMTTASTSTTHNSSNTFSFVARRRSLRLNPPDESSGYNRPAKINLPRMPSPPIL
ncbi:hypothetical protein HZH68_012937 [Vespula germanica]|uniref:Uncharacterized protein n=1 Tax=Vespula germanica TaxID=30212 RepID=A0A834MWN3_VESGE|nr:hypothetical protein HZH68_012937 [Vespula germanica]